MPSAYTGVQFVNRFTESADFNIFRYRNLYNGGGVGLGDLTGDGLPEIVLTSNTDGPRLYLNAGHFHFRDVTQEAGLQSAPGTWTTGVTFADVNGDGKLDIYICHAGNSPPERRHNALYINQGLDKNGVPTFKDEAEAYGVADVGGYATQAVFFDYDRDGRLDLLVVRNSPKPVTSFGMKNTRNVRDPYGGARLYHNDGTTGGPSGRPHFTDVSAKAGIFAPENAFGLGVVVADVNRDGWPDLYVSHDYYEHDYLYLNNRDGTFAESLDQAMAVDSYFSMGLDVADLDNDGRPDVYTTDMLPEDESRLKTMTSYEGWDVYQAKVRTGYGHQLMRNMLQHNDGVSRAGLTFSEVGQMAGVANTDWSWGALIADLDLDGRKDIFVTNGVAKDVTNQDYVAYLADQETMREVTTTGKVDFMRLIGAMPSTPIPNYAFHNDGGLRFTNESAAWGLATPSFSNGAAYGDLDGDGAPDLVVNNVGQEAFVYRNNARTLLPDRHFLQLQLVGDVKNRFAVGAKATVRAGGGVLYQELAPTRGFESSSDYVLSFGLGGSASADSVTIEWPDGRVTTLRQVAANRRLTVRQAEAPVRDPDAPPLGRAGFGDSRPGRPIFTDVTAEVGLDYAHHENDFVDFDRDRLTPKMLSTEGPALAVGDVNGDGLDDLYLGGAKEQPGRLMLQQPDGHFARSTLGVFEQDAISEDVGAVFFDANGDGRPDLYVVSGGSEFSADSPGLQDRLYLNDGRGKFHKTTDALPSMLASGSRVVAADFDGDGAIDLFVGGRVVLWEYGVPARSAMLRNNGRAHFTDVTDRVAPGLSHIGMVTDAAWRDVDGDGRPDLVVVGEWMRVTVFHNAGGGRLVPAAGRGLERSNGWYNRVLAGDLSGTGRTDLLLANLGLNTRLHASPTQPATMLVKDFDGNGYVEQVLSCFNGDRSYPIELRDDLLKALPSLKARYPNYKSFALATTDDMFTPQERAGAVSDTAFTFATAIARNDGNGRFTLVPLPREAQQAPVYAMLSGDFDGDGHQDLLLAGNFDGVRPDIGRMEASDGLLLRGDGRGGYTPLSGRASGFVVSGQARDIARVRTRRGTAIIVARNNDRPLFFRSTPVSSPTTIARR